jgi:alanyl-tRNA synthetase
MALALRGRLERAGGGAAVLGSGGDRALLVAAVTNDLAARGVTAPALLELAAKEVGGKAGGKPTLAFGGGANAAAVGQALSGIRPRLEALLAGA